MEKMDLQWSRRDLEFLTRHAPTAQYGSSTGAQQTESQQDLKRSSCFLLLEAGKRNLSPPEPKDQKPAGHRLIEKHYVTHGKRQMLRVGEDLMPAIQHH